MKKIFKKVIGAAVAVVALTAGSATPGLAAEEEIFKIGLVSYISGETGQIVGSSVINAAKLMGEALNQGSIVPAPYGISGMGGIKIEFLVVDEAGDADLQVKTFQELVTKHNVDAVIGYENSDHCLAVAKEADRLKAFTLFTICSTPSLFEDGEYEYAFRSSAHSVASDIALARYMKSRNYLSANDGALASVSVDSSWGQETQADFIASVKALSPDFPARMALTPKRYAKSYGREILALLALQPRLVYSNFFLEELKNFILQVNDAGLPENMRLALPLGTHIIPVLGDKMPEGVIVGSEGIDGYSAGLTKNPLNDWLVGAFRGINISHPGPAVYKTAQGILGLKRAVEKAMQANGGVKPNSEQLAQAMVNLSWDSPSGRIEMALGNGHQAIQPSAIGRTKRNLDTGEMTLEDIEIFGSRCINPPAGVKAADWIRTGLAGAECD